jgi:tetratricopeptide (TPR) repeat protein
MKSIKHPFAIFSFLIVSLCFSIYYSSLFYGFFSYDDPTYLLSNEGVINFDWRKIFSPLASAYSPLTFLSYALEHALIQFQPFYYHVTNTVLHTLNSLLAAYFIFRISNKNLLISAFVGLLFAAHPLRVESVVWITERKDVLSIFFYLSALIAYVNYLEQKKNRFGFLTFLLFVCSVLSKSTSVSFPLLLVAFDFYFRRSISRRVVFEKIPFFIVSLVIGLFQVKLLSTKSSAAQPFDLHFLDAITSFAFYISKTIAPVDLAVFYERNAVSVSALEYAMASFFILIIGACYFRFKDQRRAIVLGMAFFVFSLLPVSQILPFGTGFIFADRYMYLPSIGMFFVCALVLTSTLPRIAFVILTATLTIACGYASFERTKVWRSSESLWKDVLQKYPNSSVASNNLGIEYFQMGKMDDAVTHFQNAVTANPTYLEAHNNLGGALTTIKELDRAFQAFQAALKIDPKDAGAHYGLGNIYTSLGRTVDAKSEYLLALNSEPDHISARVNLGLTYLKEGHGDRAKEQFNLVLEKNPMHEKARKALNSIPR